MNDNRDEIQRLRAMRAEAINLSLIHISEPTRH